MDYCGSAKILYDRATDGDIVPRRRPAACPRDPGKASPTLELDKLISYPCIFYKDLGWMRRHELTDEQFKKIESMLPGRKGHVGVTAQDNRIFINGVLWIFKTGAPWRDLPERYGHWKNVHRRFSRWSKAGIFDRKISWKLLDAKNDLKIGAGSGK